MVARYYVRHVVSRHDSRFADVDLPSGEKLGSASKQRVRAQILSVGIGDSSWGLDRLIEAYCEREAPWALHLLERSHVGGIPGRVTK